MHGYAIPASAFHRQEDGSYLAEVTGDMGHAWCEVYSDSQWILKEHTLPYYGTRPTPGTPAAASEKRTWIPNTAGRLLLALKHLSSYCGCSSFTTGCIPQAAQIPAFPKEAGRRRNPENLPRHLRRGRLSRNAEDRYFKSGRFQIIAKLLSGNGCRFYGMAL